MGQGWRRLPLQRPLLIGDDFITWQQQQPSSAGLHYRQAFISGISISLRHERLPLRCCWPCQELCV
jgi:hypothetical protein